MPTTALKNPEQNYTPNIMIWGTTLSSSVGQLGIFPTWWPDTLAESSCTNQEIVLANIRSVKISSPDVSWYLKPALAYPRLTDLVRRLGPRSGGAGLYSSYQGSRKTL
jgi:hypothetical protein